MFPHSSIKRLRFAFFAMAGLTMLALLVGCLTYVYSHVTQQRLLSDATPLLINVERLSKATLRFSAATQRLGTINTRDHLNRTLSDHRSKNEQLQQVLIDLVKQGMGEQTITNLNKVVQDLDALDVPYSEALRTKVDARTRVVDLQQKIMKEGQKLLERLSPLTLDASVEMLDLLRRRRGDDGLASDALQNMLNKVQLLTEISFSAERFLQIVGKDHAATSSIPASTLNETLAPAFRQLTQQVLKLRDDNARADIASSLEIFSKNTLQDESIVDQRRRLEDAVAQLDQLTQQQTQLLTRMTNIVDRIVIDARNGFFESAANVQRSSLLGVSTLSVLSVTAFCAVIWIGWRLINRDIAQRLERLATSTVALANGDLEVDIDQSGSDELTDMARAAEIFRRNALELHRAETELADRLVEAEKINQKLELVNAALDSTNVDLANHTRELERSNRELDDFAYIASHDLKEPLRAMYNHASFVLEDCQGKLDEESEKRLNRMIKLSRRMEQLIADLLYFSRLGRGDQVMDAIDLNSLIADIEANLVETLKSRNARIRIPEHLPSIRGHPAHITALFQNLISNGIRYNDAEDKVVEIGLVPAAPDKGTEPFETLYVRDNGIGIEEQFQEDVFRIFKRLNSEKTYGEGTGAGLTFVKKIVENHRGRVWFDSKIGEGTTFFFTLQHESLSSASEAADHAA